MKRLVKRFSILSLLLIFLFSTNFIVFAEKPWYEWENPEKIWYEQKEDTKSTTPNASENNTLHQNISPKDAPLYDAIEYYEDPENKPSYGERFISGILLGFAKWGFNALGMEDVTLLVFGKNPRAGSGDTFMTGGTDEFDVRGEKLLGVFNEKLFAYLSFFYEKVEQLLPIPLVIILSVIGLLMIAFSNSQEGKSKIKDYIQAFVVALVSLRFSVYLFVFLANARNLMTDWIWYFIESIGVEHGLFVDMIWGTGKAGFDGFANAAQSIGVAILALLALFMSMILNYQYKMMMYIIAFLIITFPIVATLSIFPKFRNAIIVWWEEFIANMFMPVAHAITIAVFFMVLSAKEGLWSVLPFFFGMPVIVNLFRKILGIQSGGGFMGAMGTTLGLTALMRMGSMFKKDKTASKAPSESTVPTTDFAVENNYKTPSKTLPKTGTSTTQRNYQKKSGSANTGGRFAGAGKITGTALKAVGKTAIKGGKVASTVGGIGIGAAVSTMATGNPMVGGLIGGKIGHSTGKGIEKMGQEIGDVVSGGKEAYSNYKENGMSVADTLQQRHVQGEAGALNRVLVHAGWGAERFANVVTGGRFGKSAVARKDYLTTNREGYQNAVESMQKIQPELDIAKENYTAMKAKYGPGSHYHNLNVDQRTGKFLKPDEYVKAEEHFNKIQSEYSTHKANAMKHQQNLSNYNQMKQHIQQFKETPPSSPSRGRL